MQYLPVIIGVVVFMAILVLIGIICERNTPKE